MTTVLHIGAHKTASTHLQRTLSKHADLLRARGVVALGPRELRKAPLNITAAADSTDTTAPGVRRQMFETLVGPRKRLVLSEENILGSAHNPEMVRTGRFYPRGEARLARILEAFEFETVELMCAVRDPAGFFVSAYSQRLLSGRLLTFEDFLEGRDVALMRWSECLARLAALPQVSRLTVWAYEDYHALAPAILARLLGDEASRGLVWPRRIVHPGLSQRAYDQMIEWVQADHLPSERGHARDARALFPKTKREPGYQPWSADALARSAALYTDDLRRIDALPGVDRLRPSVTP